MKIIVGMSGGFDSSYAAKMLLDAGHTVEGVALVMHEYADTKSAQDAAEKLGIPLSVIDCREPFSRIVRENFVSEYREGRTPNPCIVCNPAVKFAALAEIARERGFDRIATGHYAGVSERTLNGVTERCVIRALDTRKDQSYMLYRLPRDILDILILPLGEYRKDELRESVRGTDLSSFDTKDSQEICFIPDGDYAAYIERQGIVSPAGDFIDEDGKRLGTHGGIIRYTVGQRKGLGISLGARAFVTEIDPINNTVTLASSPKMQTSIKLKDVICHAGITSSSQRDYRLGVKIRYAAPISPATVSIDVDGGATVTFDSPERSVTPGQSAVFYDGDAVVGGGVICN